MISQEKPLSKNRYSPKKQSNLNTKKRLVARWQTINGKLIRKWITKEAE